MYTGAVACPAEPEQADGEGDPAGHDERESPFGHRTATVGRKLAIIGGHGENDDDDAHNHPKTEGEEGEARLPGVEAMHPHEDKRVRFEEEVEDAVDEGHVEADQEEHGLDSQHDEGAGEVLGEDVAEAHFHLLLRRVNRPIARLLPQ